MKTPKKHLFIIILCICIFSMGLSISSADDIDVQKNIQKIEEKAKKKLKTLESIEIEFTKIDVEGAEKKIREQMKDIGSITKTPEQWKQAEDNIREIYKNITKQIDIVIGEAEEAGETGLVKIFKKARESLTVLLKETIEKSFKEEIALELAKLELKRDIKNMEIEMMPEGLDKEKAKIDKEYREQLIAFIIYLVNNKLVVISDKASIEIILNLIISIYTGDEETIEINLEKLKSIAR